MFKRVLRSCPSVTLTLTALLMLGCSATTPFSARSPDTTLEVQDSGTLGYKSRENDEWRLYKPLTAESDRARAYFQAK